MVHPHDEQEHAPPGPSTEVPPSTTSQGTNATNAIDLAKVKDMDTAAKMGAAYKRAANQARIDEPDSPAAERLSLEE